MVLDDFVDRPVRGEMNEGRLAYGAKVRTLKELLVDTIGVDRSVQAVSLFSNLETSPIDDSKADKIRAHTERR
jgi:hypothetical protein